MNDNTKNTVREVTDSEVDAFADNGWVSLPGLIHPDLIKELLEKAKHLMGESGANWKPRPGLDVEHDVWHDCRFMSREGIEPFRSLALGPNLGRAAQRLNERPIPIRYYSDMLAVKPPAGSSAKNKETPVHQDYPNRQFDRIGNVGFWIALDEIPADRGTMRFYSGSHKLGPLGHNFGLASGDPDVRDTYPWIEKRCPLSKPLNMKPGDATAHSALVLHTAAQNTTNVPRWTYIVMYFPADTLWTGSKLRDEASQNILKAGEPFDHPNFPIVYP
jgi:ectoine hydroxylase-related dioxygenase (phytanoyl-CoA dioxygenase family)